jgi:transposase-like protein
LEEEMSISKEEKAMWLEDWKQSGKGAWAYARENGLIPQTFKGWVNQEAKILSGFVEIPDRIKPRQDLHEIIIVEKGEIKIHIPLFVWTENSRSILEGLKAVL